MRDFGTTYDIFHTFAGKKQTNKQRYTQRL